MTMNVQVIPVVSKIFVKTETQKEETHSQIIDVATVFMIRRNAQIAQHVVRISLKILKLPFPEIKIYFPFNSYPTNCHFYFRLKNHVLGQHGHLVVAGNHVITME